MSWEAVAVADTMGKRLRTAEERGIMWYEKATELQGRLQVKEAQIAGLVAQIQALREAHPDSPLLVRTTSIFQNGQHVGKAKTKLRLIYERAHDAAAKKMGIANPVEMRDN